MVRNMWRLTEKGKNLCMYCGEREATKEATVRGVRLLACDECFEALQSALEQPPEKVEREMLNIMKRAGIDPAKRYAFQRTGRIVTEQNMGNLTEEELTEWADAIREYYRMHRSPALFDVRITTKGQV